MKRARRRKRGATEIDLRNLQRKAITTEAAEQASSLTKMQQETGAKATHLCHLMRVYLTTNSTRFRVRERSKPSLHTLLGVPRTRATVHTTRGAVAMSARLL